MIICILRMAASKLILIVQLEIAPLSAISLQLKNKKLFSARKPFYAEQKKRRMVMQISPRGFELVY